MPGAVGMSPSKRCLFRVKLNAAVPSRKLQGESMQHRCEVNVSGSRRKNLLNSAVMALLLGLLIAACGKDSGENAQANHESAGEPSSFAAGAQEVPVNRVAGTNGVLSEAKKNSKDKKKDEDEEEEEKDYWKDVRFDREHFEEVQNFVRVNYIDPETSEDRALGEACNFALLGLNKPVMLLPTSFYKKRKGHEDEEGALDGKSRSFGKERSDPRRIYGGRRGRGGAAKTVE